MHFAALKLSTVSLLLLHIIIVTRLLLSRDLETKRVGNTGPHNYGAGSQHEETRRVGFQHRNLFTKVQSKLRLHEVLSRGHIEI